MALFDMPVRADVREADKRVLGKAKSKTVSTPKIRNGTGLASRIADIQRTVETNLGQYKTQYEVITSHDRLAEYIDTAIANKYLSVDTETDGLDPLRNKLAGVCIYTDGEKGAYVPVNHINYITNERVNGQLDVEYVISQLKRLSEQKQRPEIDMFNAKFDIRFLRANGWKDAYCTWDGYLASRLLNENEEHRNLKQLHNKYCLDGKGDAFRFDDLFKGIPFTLVPYSTGYLYAAHDPVITTELCEYQRKYLRPDSQHEDLRKLYWVFENIEMPCIDAVANMEDNGILFDMEYQSELSQKYNEMLQEKLDNFYDALHKYDKQISDYRKHTSNCKLDEPINIASPTQLAILLYDIIKYEAVDKKSPRGTGVEILRKIDSPITSAILEYREVQKLISTYIDKLPECVNPDDGRIHCNFNQYGADTGRMSSSDPNLQNIPSHNKDIRKMFIASPGYVLMSSDFSQQEPKCLAALCKKQGDSQMYNTFMQGKDLYSEIASKAFNRDYDECREFNADGSTNKEGKARRTQAKSILLGVLYGRGVPSIAEQLGCSADKAQSIKDSVFRGFPAIRQFERNSLDMAHELGYVTTVCGRKRRLPALQLDEYEFEWIGGSAPDDDILDFDADDGDAEVPDRVKRKYITMLHNCRFNQKYAVINKARNEGIAITDNGGKIADAVRQCVNSRIQGSAADLTKLAMIELNKSDELKQLGFRLLIPVHDEIIAECPEENMQECSKLLAETMSKAAEKILEMPIKCDVDITRAWYGEKLDGSAIKQRETNTSHGMDVDKLRGEE